MLCCTKIRRSRKVCPLFWNLTQIIIKKTVAKKIYDLADGQGCHAVYDGVGKDTFEADFTLLRRKGTLVTIGNASGGECTKEIDVKAV